MSEIRVATRPADRYGRTVPSARKMVTLGAVLTASITAWAAWASLGSADPVAYSTLSQRVVDQTLIDVTFQVSMPPGARAICTVRAVNTVSTPVGNVDVTVGPSTDRSFSVTVRLPTMEQAAAGDVKACVLA
jgi:hypothetical protein